MAWRRGRCWKDGEEDRATMKRREEEREEEEVVVREARERSEKRM
jgi:hypothetical protein